MSVSMSDTSPRSRISLVTGGTPASMYSCVGLIPNLVDMLCLATSASYRSSAVMIIPLFIYPIIGIKCKASYSHHGIVLIA